MSTSHPDRILALAGICQAARLAQDLARRGKTDKVAFAASIQSILRMDAVNAPAVYGGEAGVALGLTLLRDQLHVRVQTPDIEGIRYILSLIQLERTLAKRPDMLARIGHDITHAETQMKFFEETENTGDDPVHPRLVEKLAELYTQTISTLTPRIMVNGEHGNLTHPAIAAGVRAALLAGIRSAVLWRQLGGRRWQLLFMRRNIGAQAAAILKKMGQ